MNTYKKIDRPGPREVAEFGRGKLPRRDNIILMTFTGDELFLALIGLVRATRPAMLRQEADGFSVDFEAIASSKTPAPADRLLLKIGALMNAAEATPENSTEAPADNGSRSLELDAAEARQIADALAKLERLQAWPEDVMNMSRALRARLTEQT